MVELAKLEQDFKGENIIEAIDAIEQFAAEHRLVVNIIDPEFNRGPIDNDPHRLNVRTDMSGRIVRFTIG